MKGKASDGCPVLISPLLEQPNFMIRVDPTLTADAQASQAQPCAVMSAGQDPELLYDPAYVSANTERAAAALEHLRLCIEQSKFHIQLEQGDLLVFDNPRSVHARSAYTPRFDGSDRWLLRALVLESYWKTPENLGDLATGRAGGALSKHAEVSLPIAA